MNKKVLFKEKLLDAVMYRIMSCDSFGVKRAFLFAQEFKRDISIFNLYTTLTDVDEKGIIENNCVLKTQDRKLKELHQRLVNALASQIDSEKLDKEKVVQLRIQKKVEKAKKV